MFGRKHRPKYVRFTTSRKPTLRKRLFKLGLVATAISIASGAYVKSQDKE